MTDPVAEVDAGLMEAADALMNEAAAAAKSLWMQDWDERPEGIALRDAIYAALQAERERAAERWLPMDSAPRDGTRVLATGGGLTRPIEIVAYNERVGCWCAEVDTLDDTDFEPQGYNRPTHWQPLPSAAIRALPLSETETKT